MTKDDKLDGKKSFTLRLSKELSERIGKEAEELGLSKSSYIKMVLHKTLRQENIS